MVGGACFTALYIDHLAMRKGGTTQQQLTLLPWVTVMEHSLSSTGQKTVQHHTAAIGTESTKVLRYHKHGREEQGRSGLVPSAVDIGTLLQTSNPAFKKG